MRVSELVQTDLNPCETKIFCESHLLGRIDGLPSTFHKEMAFPLYKEGTFIPQF